MQVEVYLIVGEYFTVDGTRTHYHKKPLNVALTMGQANAIWLHHDTYRDWVPEGGTFTGVYFQGHQLPLD